MLDRGLGTVVLALQVLVALRISSCETLASRRHGAFVSVLNRSQKAMETDLPGHDRLKEWPWKSGAEQGAKGIEGTLVRELTHSGRR